MSPTTLVSSANLMIWFPSCLDAKSSVGSVNNNGLSTQPWRDPVLSVMKLKVLFLTQTNWGLSIRKSWIHRHVVVFSLRRRSFSISFLGMMVLNEIESIHTVQDSGVGVFLVQMSDDQVQSGGYCIPCRAIGMISKLVWFMWGGEAGCDVWFDKLLKII